MIAHQNQPLFRLGPKGCREHPAETAERVNVPAMYELREKWAELAARELLNEPTGGIVVISYAHSVDWATPIKAALQRRGGEHLSVCGLAITGEVLFGDDWSRSQPSTPVTVVNDVCTLGTDLLRMLQRLMARRIGVMRLHALVHRAPSLPATYDGLPYRASVHFRQALIDPSSCPDCRQGQPIRPLRA